MTDISRWGIGGNDSRATQSVLSLYLSLKAQCMVPLWLSIPGKDRVAVPSWVAAWNTAAYTIDNPSMAVGH